MAARRLRSRPDPNAPTHHDRDVVASRRSASRVAWGFPSGAQGSGPPTHLHASCDNAYALTVRIRSKLTLPPIVSSSTEARCRRRPRQLNTVAAFAHQRPLHELVPRRTGIRRRLEPAPVLQPRTPHSSPCSRVCTLLSCTRVSSTRSPLSRMTMSDLFTSLDRTGIRRRLEPAPVLQPRTPHSSTCARLCTLFSCTRVFLVLGARPSICFRCTSRVISVTEP